MAMEEVFTPSTLLDIAKKLNITTSTVSRALNGHNSISHSTREAVKLTATRLNYHPNKIASSLRLGKSRIIGIIIPSAEINFFGSVVHGIEKIAAKHDYSVLMYQSSELADNEKNGVRTFLRSRVDGVLASISKETTTLDHFVEIKRRGVPLVLFDRVNDELSVPSVVVNDFRGAYNATQHLIEQSCKRIVHLAGPSHVSIFRQRLKGYKKALQDNGLPVNNDLIRTGEISVESGYKCMKNIIHSGIMPDGVFAVEDFTALGAMQALKDLGKVMPREVAIIGFANEAFGEYITPSLSTVDQQTIKMGEKAAQMFFDLTDKDIFYKIKPPKIILEPVLIFRQSSLRKHLS